MGKEQLTAFYISSCAVSGLIGHFMKLIRTKLPVYNIYIYIVYG